MQIPQQLPQFDNTKTLLVILGSHHGKIYYAHDGVIELIDDIRVDDPQYSDNEGMFKRGANRDGGDFIYGSVLETNKEKVLIDFSKSIVKK